MGFLNWCAAGPLSGFMGFQNWRMAPGPDPKGFLRAKMSLELALAMLRLAPWLVLWGFKTDGWPPVPIPKASQAQNVFSHAAAGPLSGFMGFQNRRIAPCPDRPDPKGFPRPKMLFELALAMLRLAPSLVLWDFKTDGWPPGPKCCWSWL